MNDTDDYFLKQMKGVNPIKKNNRIENNKPKSNKIKNNKPLKRFRALSIGISQKINSL